MRRHHRSRRENYWQDSSNNAFIAILIFIFILFLITRMLAGFYKQNTDIIMRVLSLSLIAVLVGVITLVAYLLLDHMATKYVNAHSVAINTLNDLNDKYKFNEIARMDLYHSYDNANFYEDISPTDYLICSLTYNSSKVKKSIELLEENKRLYESYIKELSLIKRVQFEVPKPLVWYFRYKEERIFNNLVQHPTTKFDIIVGLRLTKINGVYLESKSRTFDAQEIKQLIDGVSNKDAGFYKDRNVWDAICRVERGKVSNKMRFAIYERDGYRCRKCGSPNDLEVDHIFPIAKGGKTEFNNLQTLCHQCNLLKSDSVEHGTYDPKYDKKMHICPNCGVKLVLRNGRNGQFYGCPNYPNCRHTEKV